MAVKGDALSIDYGKPKQVKLEDIEAELDALVNEANGTSDSRRVFGRALTLVVYTEADHPAEEVDRLIGEIITRSSARAITIRAKPGTDRDGIEAYVRAHCISLQGNTQQCAEQVILHVLDKGVRQLPDIVTRLRLRDLPIIVWWRAQPDPDNPLFDEMLRVGDQVVIDSALFSLSTEQFAALVGRLRRESEQVPFGDINWARLTAWRELVAQFFDVPEHLPYLTKLNEISLEYSARGNGNPAQAMLLTMWMATMLNWQVVSGSWQREGKARALRLRAEDREIRVGIRAVMHSDAPPGWLDSVTLYVRNEPAASFRINWCGENCVTTLVKLGDKVSERSAALNIPDEVTLLCSELDASHRDRIYHHALEVLEQLVA